MRTKNNLSWEHPRATKRGSRAQSRLIWLNLIFYYYLQNISRIPSFEPAIDATCLKSNVTQNSYFCYVGLSLKSISTSDRSMIPLVFTSIALKRNYPSIWTTIPCSHLTTSPVTFTKNNQSKRYDMTTNTNILKWFCNDYTYNYNKLIIINYKIHVF